MDSNLSDNISDSAKTSANENELESRVNKALLRWASSIGEHESVNNNFCDAVGDSVDRQNCRELQHDSEVGATLNKCRKYRPWDYNNFLQRIETFSPINWSGKFNCINYACCAAYGYENSGLDELCCVLCNVTAVFAFDPSIEESEENYSLSFFENLKTLHKTFCPWRKRFTTVERAEAFICRWEDRETNNNEECRGKAPLSIDDKNVVMSLKRLNNLITKT